MATIINIRGTGGSGKSYIVFQMIKEFGIKSKITKAGKVIGYRLKNDVMIVGKYETDCGGCDQIKTQDEICDRVRSFAKKGRVVVFEGLLISGLYSRYLALAQSLKKAGHKYYWMFLDTPLEKCYDRTIARRKAKGNKRPFNPQNTKAKHRAVELALQHALEDREAVLEVDHRNAHKNIIKMVRQIA